jgi:hypothetical protein
MAGAGGAGAGGAGAGGAGAGGAGAGGAGAGGAGAGGAGAGGAGAGGAGAGGAGAGGAGAGGAGAGGAGAGGGGGSGPTATGVMRLSLPFTASGQGQRYNVQNRTNPSAPYDMSGQTLTIRVYAPGATGGDLSVFFRSLGGTDTTPVKVPFTMMTAGFVDISIPVPAMTATYNPVMTEIIRIEPETDPAFGSSWTNPTLIVLDSIVSTSGTVNIPFNTDPGAGSPIFSSSGARPGPTGTTTTWAAAYP